MANITRERKALCAALFEQHPQLKDIYDVTDWGKLHHRLLDRDFLPTAPIDELTKTVDVDPPVTDPK